MVWKEGQDSKLGVVFVNAETRERLVQAAPRVLGGVCAPEPAYEPFHGLDSRLQQ